MTEQQARSIHDEEVAAFRDLWRKGVSYVLCRRDDCPFMHLMVDGHAYAEWTHPQQPRPAVSPFVRRALARELPAKVVR